MLKIVEATEADIHDVFHVEEQAFGGAKGTEIADLVSRILKDPSAEPKLSLIAVEDGRTIGHVLFSKARIVSGGNGNAGSGTSERLPEAPASATLLAPLAVIPEAQSRGVGGKLIQEGLKILAERGVDLAFVLGHPGYYPRYGFSPAGVRGFDAPYPIPEEHAGAWMIQELRPGAAESCSGTVLCADELNRPEHWRE